MPDSRRHRGAHPEDARDFDPGAIPRLVEATADLCWLLERGYTGPSALKLVGDHHQLGERQRLAVMRSACSDTSLRGRGARCVPCSRLGGEELVLDGYNVLTTLEAALAGGVILVGRDECFRDLAAMHGTWRRVDETLPALDYLGRLLETLGPRRCHWLLDRPVSNSGRLRAAMVEIAEKRGWPWEVELVLDPDAVLKRSEGVVATSDSVVLDRAPRWCNLAREAVERCVPAPWIVDLRPARA